MVKAEVFHFGRDICGCDVVVIYMEQLVVSLVLGSEVSQENHRSNLSITGYVRD
ncbi:MAG: hypothetical protein OXC44_05460 [Proteobacteria bacterium]|nr:hypothetical protein [Pseudomonadota bacterium]